MFDWSLPESERIPLDPSVEEWQRLTELVTEYLGEALRDLADVPTVVEAGAHDLASANAPLDFTGVTQLSSYLNGLFEPGFNPAHPGFMAYIPGGGLVTSALADWLVKTMNRYGTAHFASPALGELEYQVIRMFADWVGYPEEAAGVLTTGGSVANFTALVTARRALLPENFLNGVLFCSDQTHHSVMKAANLAGFAAKNVQLVPTDDGFRLDAGALQRAIDQQRAAGKTPFLVVASAGTTNTGSIDPLTDVAHICQRENLWFHVDAAYGGAFVITQRGQARLNGLAQADSVTLDPHKSLFLPYGTGSILVKDRERLIEAHEMRGDYMPDLDHRRAHLDPFSLSVELSREHRGLKVALPFMLHGKQAFVDALNEKLDLTEQLYADLNEMPQIELLHQPDLTTIAFRLAGKRGDADNRALLDTINAGGKVYLSGTVLNDRFAPRISILSHRTHAHEVKSFLAELQRALDTLG